MYKIDQRVGITDVDSNGVLTLSAIIGYFQNCCGFQSADLSVGDDFLSDHGVFWVLTSWQVHVDRYPAINERLQIYTRPYDIKGFMGFRNFYIIDESGEMIAKANTLWTLLSLETGSPARVTTEMVEAYGKRDRIDMDYAPRKIDLPSDGFEMQEYSQIEVLPYMLDTNKHVNNGQYIKMAECYLPENFKTTDFRAEYKAQARLGDVLRPIVYKAENNSFVVCMQGEEKPFALMEFK